MKLLPPSQNQVNRTAIFWALLSQSIWLPVFISGFQDERSGVNSRENSFLNLQNQQKSADNLSFKPEATTISTNGRLFQAQSRTDRHHTGIVLNSVFVDQRSSIQPTSRVFTLTRTPNSTYAASKPTHPYSSDATLETNSKPEVTGLMNSGEQRLYPSTLIQRLYSRSELLGGVLTLRDLVEPLMPPIARAERAQWSRSGDPLAPLPQIWREPMRRALNSLVNDGGGSTEAKIANRPEGNLLIDSARFVHVPSTKIRRASEVPLALQADGTVDILNRPDDPAVIDEINRWSVRQKLPAKGKISPAVVHLHPMDPLTIGRSTNDKPDTQGNSQMRTTEAVVPAPPAPEPKAFTTPAPAAVQPTPPGADLMQAPITSAIPAPTSQPDPARASEAES
jgi:hypothetical protein